MRYNSNETTAVAGKLPTGGSVTIKVVLLETDTIVDVSSNVCNESQHIEGMYIWDTSNILTKSGHMLYEMTDGTNKAYGKLVYGGYVDDIVTNDSLTTELVTVPDLVWNKVV